MKKTNLIDFIKNVALEIDIFKNQTALDEKTEIVSELVMHKVLYFIYGGFYKNFKKELWEPKFESWKYGPVEIQYRDNINDEKALNKIFFFNEDEYNNEEIKYLKKLIIGLIKMGVYNLVEFSHETDPWINNSNKPIGFNSINKIEIQKFFSSNLII